MSRRFSLHILLPIEGYEEDKIYESEDISLKMMNPNTKPDDVYYRRLKENPFIHLLMILLDLPVKSIR